MSSIESNPRIAFFRSYIGKTFDDAPSAVTRWLGGILKQVEEGEVVAEYTVRDDMTNPMKTLHGGVAAMIMDDLMGAMVYLLGNPHAHTSVNLNCDFLNPAPVGTKLTATANVIRKGKNIVHCESVIVNEQGRIIAKSASNLIVTPLRLEQ